MGRPAGGLLALLTLAALSHTSLTQDTGVPLCGSFDLRGYGCSLTMGDDAAPCLLAADAAAAATALYADAFKRDSALYIGSSVTLTKPLIVGNYLPVYIAAGVTLTLRAQPYLPRPSFASVFQGPGRVAFAGGVNFETQPEWWPSDDGTGGLQRAVDSCSGARCRLIIQGVHVTSKRVTLGGNVAVWGTPGTQLKAGSGSGEGFDFAPGDYAAAGEQFIPSMSGFTGFAIRATGTRNLRAYTPVITTGGDGVVFATSAAAKSVANCSVTAILMASLTTAVAVDGAPGGSLSGVSTYSANYAMVKAGPPAAMVLLRGAATANKDLRFSWSNFSPGKLNSAWSGLRNVASGAAAGVAFTVRCWAGAFPAGAPIVWGKFTGLLARVVVTLIFPGQVQMSGTGNYVEWGGLNRLQSYVMATAPLAGAPPAASLIGSSWAAIQMPKITAWPAGAARTFYLYHQLVASGGASNFVLGPGPVPPSHPLLTNPGLAVVSVVDDSAAKPYQLRVTLKNISGRTLTDSDLHYLNSPAPLTFTLTAASPPALDIVALMGRVV